MDPRDPSQRGRHQRTAIRNRSKSTMNDKVYPMRHCLMIGGAVLVVLDIGLFIGSIAIIASGIDMNMYGFAAMLTFSMLTMVFACLAFICGYRAHPPRSVVYEKSSAPKPTLPPSPKKPAIPTRTRSPRQPRPYPPDSRPVMPVRVPPTQHVKWQQRPAAPSSSKWSGKATYGTSMEDQDIEKTRRTKRYKRETDI